jgi:hypothetical protein
MTSITPPALAKSCAACCAALVHLLLSPLMPATLPVGLLPLASLLWCLAYSGPNPN